MTISPAPFRLAGLVVSPAKSASVRKPRLPVLSGIASWYGAVLHGHRSANGEIFDEAEFTAAHQTLPFGTRVRVVDLVSGRSVIVRITDRGILSPGRIIDLSSAAADELGILQAGVARVKLEVLKGASAAKVAVDLAPAN